MPRHAAWRLLRSGTPTPLRDVDRIAAARELDPRDRSLVRRLVGTEVRRRGTLRALVAHFARGKPSADVAAHLRLGFTQIFFLDRVPPHAAVSETVRATADTAGLARGRYVNGVLRTALRARRPGSSGDPRRDLVGREWHFDDPVFRDPETHPFLWAEDALSMPAAMLKRWAKRHGRERAFELAELALDEPPLSLVAPTGMRDSIADELVAADVPVRRSAHERILLVPAAATEPALSMPAFLSGQLRVQGETALRAAERVEALAGERILELCAAPGGKTIELATNGAEVLALDVAARRLTRVRESVARQNPTGIVRVAACDGTAGLADGVQFDAALVDAPCSNTGVLAGRPAARWRFGPASQNDLVALQSRLVDEAAARVRPGGRLVYSTCSLEPEENSHLVKAFLERHPDWSLGGDDEALPAALRPKEGDDDDLAGPIDGGYRALLVRRAEGSARAPTVSAVGPRAS